MPSAEFVYQYGLLKIKPEQSLNSMPPYSTGSIDNHHMTACVDELITVLTFT